MTVTMLISTKKLAQEIDIERSHGCRFSILLESMVRSIAPAPSIYIYTVI